MTWIKICATTNLADAASAVAAGADALGFILAPSTRRVEAESAAGIIRALPGRVEKIGVVVNEEPQTLAGLADYVGLTGIQLHGDESPEQLPSFRAALGPRKIIKTLQARELLAGHGEGLLNDVLRFVKYVDAVLVDSGVPSRRGGTGIPFDWNASLLLISRIKEAVPVIIAGGLTPTNVADALNLFHPWGVDVVSGVEREIGSKDGQKVAAFIRAVRRAEAQPVLRAANQ